VDRYALTPFSNLLCLSILADSSCVEIAMSRRLCVRNGKGTLIVASL
jgi:hypothetical protein